MFEILERIWGASYLQYPNNAHTPRRDTLAANQMHLDETRRVLTNVEDYHQRRRSSIADRRSSLFQPLDKSQINKLKNIAQQKIEDEKYSDDNDIRTLMSFPSTITEKSCELDTPIHDREEPCANDSERPRSRPTFVGHMKRHAPLMASESFHTRKQYPITIHSELHRVMFDFCDSRTFSGFILIVILLNSAMLVAQTFLVVQVRCDWIFGCVDNAFLGIYIFELCIKLYAWRLKYFNEAWNWLDFVIVIFNIIDFILPLVIQNLGEFNGAAIFRLLRIFRSFRALRALRVLRTIRFLANLQVIMTTILQSIRSIGAIVMLILLFMYMFAVIGRGLYSTVDPARFGNLLYAHFTLFQLLTLDDWFEIYSHAVAEDPNKWHIILYLLLYIVVEYFIFLNLFVAVLVDNFHLTIEAQNEVNAKKKRAQDCSDDEDEDHQSMFEKTDSDTDSNFSDDMRVRKGIEEYYPEVPHELRSQLKHDFQIRASLGYNMQVLADQERILQTMVDICADTARDSIVE